MITESLKTQYIINPNSWNTIDCIRHINFVEFDKTGKSKGVDPHTIYKGKFLNEGAGRDQIVNNVFMDIAIAEKKLT